MSTKKSIGSIKKNTGIISNEMLHRIDTMNDESDADNSPYKARNKTILGDEQLFGSELYNGSDEESETSGRTVTILLFAVGLIAAIAVVLVIAL